MAVDILPLLDKLDALAPKFGRAQDDLRAMVSRGRAADYKGVMQNARLVLEALLRSLVTEELKQTPGKAMLDELVTKFRQQSNAGIVPTNILAHMGTVQAWGNLSAHDHAGSLGDSAVTVGLEEVVASLNSMVAILNWYADKKGLSSTSLPAVSSGSRSNIAAVAPRAPSRAPLFAAVGAIAAVGIVVAIIALKPSKADEVPEPPKPVVVDFSALDAVYVTRKEPIPPAACRRAEDAALLAKSASDVRSLGLIEKPSPEAAYLLARATFEELKKRSPALDTALSCPGFAAAQHLAGMMAIADGKMGEARPFLEAARSAAPSWLDNRAKLAGVLLQLDHQAEAVKEIDALISTDPDYAPGHLLRFSVLYGGGEQAEGLKSLCRAEKLGSAQARQKAEELRIDCAK